MIAKLLMKDRTKPPQQALHPRAGLVERCELLEQKWQQEHSNRFNINYESRYSPWRTLRRDRTLRPICFFLAMLAGSGAGGGRFRSAPSSASGSGAESAEEDEDEIEYLEGSTQPLAAVSHLVDLVGTRSSGDSDEAGSSSDREESTAASTAAAIAPPTTRPTAARATGADSAEDESDGFEEISASVAKRRSLKRPRVEDVAAAAALLKPQPTECTVCYDPCTITGRHRLVSLKCGHLFGKKCIERWVAVGVLDLVATDCDEAHDVGLTMDRRGRLARTATRSCGAPISACSFRITLRS